MTWLAAPVCEAEPPFVLVLVAVLVVVVSLIVAEPTLKPEFVAEKKS